MRSLLFFVVLTLFSGVASADYFPKKDWRIGLLAHNKGPIASETEDGPDITAALHYRLGEWRLNGTPIAAYGHGGAVVNTADGTSYIYAGLNGRTDLFSPNWFFEFGGGFAAHDGELDENDEGRRELGSRILFRAEFGFGYRFDSGVELGFMFDHISNGSILNSDDNKGLDTWGLRLHFPL